MKDVSPQSPEEREHRIDAGRRQIALDDLGWFAQPWEVMKRVFVGVYSDGFIHAGNLAYLALVTIFPFFIVLAAIAHSIGSDDQVARAVAAFVRSLPAGVRDVVDKPVHDVINARSGWFLWIGGAVGLWTVSSFIMTIRDILRRAYGTTSQSPFWQHRLVSIAMVAVAVSFVLLAFSVQIALVGAEQFVAHYLPWATDLGARIGTYKLVPLTVLWLALYLTFFLLMPGKYRASPVPKWPGATFVTIWWYLIVQGIPYYFARLTNYSLTYGGLTGVIIALLFFWLIGFGIVIGAHLNAALAEPHAARLEAGRPATTED